MPTTCWPSIEAEAMRVTALNDCGVPILGPTSVIATDGFVSVALSPQYEEGTETVNKLANGKIDYVHKQDDELKNISASIQFSRVNPSLFSMIMGQPVVLNNDGDATGIRLGKLISKRFALELWTEVPGVECGENKLYGYFLLPFISTGRLDDFSLQNEAASFTISNARTKDKSPWGTGPHDVVLNGTGADVEPGKLLTPIKSDEHFHMEVTEVPPPALDCSPVALAA